MEFLIAVGVFGMVAAVFYFLLAPKAQIHEEAIQRRLDTITGSPKARTTGRVRLLRPGEETVWERIVSFFLGDAAVLPERYTKIRRLLHQAGYAGDRVVRIFWGVRIFLMGVLAAAALLLAFLSQLPIPKMLLWVAVGAGSGYVLPFLIVRRKAKFRVQEIQETLPDTLDLLVICVEAGLGIDAALVRVAKEQSDQGLVIGDEFQLMSQEIQAGVLRREALSRLSERVGLDDLRGLVVFLTQTEEVGGSIARSLRVYATTMRQKRSQRAEETARKAVIKLIFPLVVFILPALFLVVLGPAFINLLKLFATAPGK